MQVSVYTRYWFKIALEHSARVGLSEYVYQNAFPTNFSKQLSKIKKKKVTSRGSGVKNMDTLYISRQVCCQVVCDEQWMLAECILHVVSIVLTVISGVYQLKQSLPFDN